MNILAHLYLSGGINNLMLGNFMGDFIKGNKYLYYTDEIQQGILLHRQIDSFTDNHKAHKTSRERFRNHYGLYSGIIIDIIYDHYLACNWDKLHPIPIEIYAQRAYSFIEKHKNTIPLRLQEIIPSLINNNWLVMYSTLDGIEKVLKGMSKRTSLPDETEFAMKVLIQNYKAISLEFFQIIDDLKKMVEKSLYLTKFAIK